MNTERYQNITFYGCEQPDSIVSIPPEKFEKESDIRSISICFLQEKPDEDNDTITKFITTCKNNQWDFGEIVTAYKLPIMLAVWQAEKLHLYFSHVEKIKCLKLDAHIASSEKNIHTMASGDTVEFTNNNHLVIPVSEASQAKLMAFNDGMVGFSEELRISISNAIRKPLFSLWFEYYGKLAHDQLSKQNKSIGKRIEVCLQKTVYIASLPLILLMMSLVLFGQGGNLSFSLSDKKETTAPINNTSNETQVEVSTPSSEPKEKAAVDSAPAAPNPEQEKRTIDQLSITLFKQISQNKNNISLHYVNDEKSSFSSWEKSEDNQFSWILLGIYLTEHEVGYTPTSWRQPWTYTIKQFNSLHSNSLDCVNVNDQYMLAYAVCQVKENSKPYITTKTTTFKFLNKEDCDFNDSDKQKVKTGLKELINLMSNKASTTKKP